MTGHPYTSDSAPWWVEESRAAMAAHRSCVRRERYRFISGGPVLTWERRVPNDSRVEQVTCDAAWFYAQMIGAAA